MAIVFVCVGSFVVLRSHVDRVRSDAQLRKLALVVRIRTRHLTRRRARSRLLDTAHDVFTRLTHQRANLLDARQLAVA